MYVIEIVEQKSNGWTVGQVKGGIGFFSWELDVTIGTELPSQGEYAHVGTPEHGVQYFKTVDEAVSSEFKNFA